MSLLSRLLSKIGTVSVFLTFAVSTQSQIVINEIHYDPDVKTQWVEFIELYNAGSTNVDLSGWSFRNGIDFLFPANTTLNAGRFLVVAQDIQAVMTKYSVSTSLMVGPFTGRLANNGEVIELVSADGQVADRVEYSLGFPWPTVGDPIPATTPGSSHSIQLTNPQFDNNLGGSWRSAAPTPGKKNSVYADNIPPQIRQVNHSPEQPVSGQAVRVTAKVSDPDGVASVTLLYQTVDPGKYIALADAQYQTAWTIVAMHDDGLEGDEIAGDFTFSAQIPAAEQKHRRLIRYLISAADAAGNTLKVPYADDPQPNFAYFVYDGIPPWTGSARPGTTQDVTYSSQMLSSIPVYHLIAKKETIEHCTWLDQDWSNEYKYIGTLVYDGVVYDHISYRTRGGVWRYSMGKNMWKINMNRGHSFQARDNYGKKYDTQWDKINLGANIQQGDYMHRGEQGMFESVGFKLFNRMGQEASNTNFVHFRIIDEENEDGKANAAHSSLTTAGTQYDGDFWGLYLATEQVDGRFLDEHDLPDGNFYKMENGTGEIRNQSPTGVSDGSDLRNFMNGYRQNSTSEWWQTNIDVDRYYNYRSAVEAIHQYDIADGKNYYYYLNPETNKWFQIPWDLDLTWADNMYGRGSDPFMQAGIFQKSDINMDYQNRMREIRDLLYNPEQTPLLIDEFASFIYDASGESFVDADRAMWDYHWVMGDDAARQGYTARSGKAGQGRFYQIAPTKNFAGMLAIMKNYVVSRGNWIDSYILNNNQDIPNTPSIKALSTDFRPESLQFEASDFSDPNSGDAFAAMKWRIAEIEPDIAPWTPTGGSTTPQEDYDLILTNNTTWKYFKGTQEPSTPTSAWRTANFDDSSWQRGTTPIGYGENVIKTTLSDMRGSYSTIYLRRSFTVNNYDDIGKLYAFVLFDDGFNMWINGVHVLKDGVDSEEMPYNGLGQHREDLNYTQYELVDFSKYLLKGFNTIAVQVLNESLGNSSDCTFDLAILSTKKVAAPTPTPTPTPGVEPTPVKPVRHRDEPLKYEIDPVWESGELLSFQKQITIPADKVVPGHLYRVRVKMKDSAGHWSHWSDPVQFTAAQSDALQLVRDNLRVSEVMYNPPGGTDFEYIELHNTHASASLSLGGFAFTEGITYTFPIGTLLPPNGYLLLTRSSTDAGKTAFRTYYGLGLSVQIAGPFTGKLANEGEKITLKTAAEGDDFISFEYSDGRGWTIAADGAGHSLVPLDSIVATETDGSLYYGANWRPSVFIGGSPGKADPTPIRNILLNEIVANASGGNDWIELYNASSSAVSLGGWFLSDDETDLKKWAIPAQEIPAGGYVSFDSNTGFNAGGNGFGLSKNGDRLFLSYLPGVAETDRVADSVAYKAQESQIGWGRSADSPAYWISTQPARQAANTQNPVSLVVNEFMYHPKENANLANSQAIGEFIELYNPTQQVVPLWNINGPWRLDGGVEYLFPANTSIPAKGFLLVVSFDPAVAADLNAFLSAYGLKAGAVTILGPYTGNLSNLGERIALEKLLEVDPADGSLAWAIVDEVIYFDRFPWTPNADGTGMSLQRISTNTPGNAPDNWNPNSPTPGSPNSTEVPVASWMLY